MIDSINLRLHGIQKYKPLELYIYTLKSSKSFENYEMNSQQMAAHNEQRKFIRYFDTGRFVALTPWQTVVLSQKNSPSSHYQVNFSINYYKDYFDFNFSIPKYVVGHNIYQFTPDPLTKGFNASLNTLELIEPYVYEMLTSLCSSFFMDNFNLEPDLRDLEIVFIDLCFNAYFTTKDDALNYFDMLKEIKKKYFRKDSNFKNNWSTSMSYTSEFKMTRIYHKGTEYAKNDKQQHIKINKNQNKKIFDIDFLQNESDKIIRYEVRYMYKFMSYIFRNYQFRNSDNRFKKYKVLFNRLSAIDRKGGLLNVPQHERKFYNSFKSMLQLTDRVYLKNDFEDIQIYLTKQPVLFARHPTENYLYHIPEKLHFKRIRFSKDIFHALVNDLKQTISEFTVGNFPSDKSVTLAIDGYLNTIRQYNKSRKYIFEYGTEKPKPLPSRSKLIQLYNMMKIYTFQDIEDRGIFPRTTWWRYRSHLKKIGITKNSMLKGVNIVPDFTYSTYFNTLIFNGKRFTNHVNFKKY